jgi:Uma2 family endonuclease
MSDAQAASGGAVQSTSLRSRTEGDRDAPDFVAEILSPSNCVMLKP